MPYLLTPEAKSRIIQGEAAMEQQQHLSSAAMQVGPWAAMRSMLKHATTLQCSV